MTLIHFFDKIVDSARLELEIINAGLSSVYDNVHRIQRDRVKVTMLSGITPAQEVTLSGIVNAHIFNTLPPDIDPIVQAINGVSGIVTLQPDDTQESITAQQLTTNTALIKVGQAVPQNSGLLIREIEERINHIHSSGMITVFGSYFYDAEIEGESSTNSTSYQQKLRLTTPSLPAGKYRVGWYFEWKGSKIDDDGQEARVQVDDTTTIMNVNPQHQSKTRKQYLSEGGFRYLTLSTGAHNIDLDYRGLNDNVGHHGGGNSTSKNTVTIRRARLEIWRVS